MARSQPVAQSLITEDHINAVEGADEKEHCCAFKNSLFATRARSANCAESGESLREHHRYIEENLEWINSVPFQGADRCEDLQAKRREQQRRE